MFLRHLLIQKLSQTTGTQLSEKTRTVYLLDGNSKPLVDLPIQWLER